MDNSIVEAIPAGIAGARNAAVSRAGHGLRVAVVDDDDSIRFLVQTLLERDGLQAETFPTAEAFLEAFRPETVGCLVLDLHLPGINGLELQELLNRQGIEIPVIVFTAQGSIPKAVTALKNGAVDFVEKPFDNKDLVRRIRDYLASESAKRAQVNASHSAAFRLASLTRREREVMDRIVAGRLNKHIADELGICIKTVEFHRSRIMQKIGVHSVAELVQLTLGTRAGRAALGEHA
ncbi:MAG: response regulator transcription factor [Betaproteobacteria bacterium]|nr:response regulator transcription factor [Betaproteobacteria bacterium]